MPFSTWRSPERWLLVFAIALVVSGWMSSTAYTAAEEEVRHTVKVRRELLAVRDGVSQAQRGQRGYLLTGREYYLDPFRTGAADARTHLSVVRELTRDDQNQQTRLKVVEGDMDELFGELLETIARVRDGDKPGAMNVLATDRGEGCIRRILSSLNACMDEEDARLLEDRKYVEWYKRLAITLLLLTGAALAAAGWFVWRAWKRR